MLEWQGELKWNWSTSGHRTLVLQGGGISRHELQAIADLETSFIWYTVLLQGVLWREQTMSKDCKKTTSSECTKQIPCYWSRIKHYIKSHKQKKNIFYLYGCVVMEIVWVWFGGVLRSLRLLPPPKHSVGEWNLIGGSHYIWSAQKPYFFIDIAMNSSWRTIFEVCGSSWVKVLNVCFEPHKFNPMYLHCF